MIVEEPVAAGSLQLGVSALEQGMIHLDLPPALPADQMVMPRAGKLVDQVTFVEPDGPCETVLREEIKRSIDRRFGQMRQGVPGALVDLRRGQPRMCMPQDMQHCHALCRYTEAA